MRRSKLSNRGAMKRIAQALNAQIWSPDTLDLIAQIMRQAGYPIADPDAAALPSMGADGEACAQYGHMPTPDGAFCKSCGKVYP